MPVNLLWDDCGLFGVWCAGEAQLLLVQARFREDEVNRCTTMFL
jgi:hypothetical protein